MGISKQGKFLLVSAMVAASVSVAALSTSATARSGVAPLDPASCSDGAYVDSPESNPGLVADCVALVAVRNHIMSDPRNARFDYSSPWQYADLVSDLFNISGEDRVIGVFLRHKQLSGSIPAELGNLSLLTWLHLQDNKFSGPIPVELGNLSYLEFLRLNNNRLSGSIPQKLGNMGELRTLDLDNNQLSGSIPAELANLSNIFDLSLGYNRLSGSIPTELSNLGSLGFLHLNNNQLSGEIPATLRVSRSFRFCNNLLTGALPVHIRTVARDFSGNISDIEFCYGGVFSDDDGSVHEYNIERMAEWGITLGCGTDRFCPSKTITRSQMAAFLYRAVTHASRAPGAVGDVELSDVAADAWYRPYARWAVATKVMRAVDGKFNPSAVVTRSDMAEMLVATFDRLPASTEIQDLFSDVTGTPSSTIRAMEGIYGAGVTRGCGAAPLKYCPNKEVTRAQMASFLTRALQLQSGF